MSICHVKSRQEVKEKHIWGGESVGGIIDGVGNCKHLGGWKNYVKNKSATTDKKKTKTN